MSAEAEAAEGASAPAATRAVAAVLEHAAKAAAEQREDQPPVRVRLTHPVDWQQRRLAALREAAELAGRLSALWRDPSQASRTR